RADELQYQGKKGIVPMSHHLDTPLAAQNGQLFIDDLYVFSEPDSKGYVLAVRLIARWMAARVTKAARVSARFSWSFARRRLRPNQEKVRSTTQRRGATTKPFLSSDRLTISMRRLGILARASVTWRAL